MAVRLQPKKVLLPAVAIITLLFLAMQFPPILLMIGVLLPVPLIFVYIQLGRRSGVILLVLVFATLFILIGAKQAVLFFTE